MTTDQNSNSAAFGGVTSFDSSTFGADSAISGGDAFTVDAFLGGTLNQQASNQSAVAPPTRSGIEFRVVREGTPTRRLRLSGARYTFGSGDGCSICLDDSTLRPLHAVLIRDDQRVVVRAYSIPIEINGNRTTEAVLEIGDIIRLGEYSFELASLSASTDVPAQAESIETQVGDLMDANASTGSESDRAPIDNEATSESGFGRLAFAEAMESNVSNAEQLADAANLDDPALSGATTGVEEQVWRERLRREIDSWRERQADCDRMTRQCHERESELRRRETELWNRADRLTTREATLKAQESAAYEIQKEYATQQQQVKLLREEREKIAAKLEQREADFRRREDEYRHQADDATQQLEQSREQAEMASKAVQRMREQLATLNSQMDELTRSRHELEVQDKQRQSELEQQRVDWDSSRQLAVLQRDEAHRERDAAIDAMAKSEAEIQRSQREAEDRIREMETQLQEQESGRDGETDQLRMSESLVDELRAQVADVQQTLQDAQNEAAQLRSEYEQARETIVTLEAANNSENPELQADRERWQSETADLRDSMESLSRELAAANEEMTQMRTANDELSQRLDVLQSQHDEAIAEVESRPTQDSFQAITQELDRTIEQLNHLQSENDALISKAENSTPIENGLQGLMGTSMAETPAADLGPQEVAEVIEHESPVASTDSPWGTTATETDEPAGEEPASQDTPVVSADAPPVVVDTQSDDDQEAWPTYDAGEGSDEAEAFTNPWSSVEDSPVASDENDEHLTSSWGIAEEPSATTEADAQISNVAPEPQASEPEGSSWSPPVDESEPVAAWGQDPDPIEPAAETPATSFAHELDTPVQEMPVEQSSNGDLPAQDLPAQELPEGSLASQLLRDIKGDEELSGPSNEAPESAWNASEAQADSQVDEDIAMTYQPTEQFSLDQHVSESADSSALGMPESDMSAIDAPDADVPSIDESDVYQPTAHFDSPADQADGMSDDSPVALGDVEDHGHDVASEPEENSYKPITFDPSSEEPEMEPESVVNEAEYVESSHVFETEAPEPVAEPTPLPASEPAPDDDSIEAYMNRLLQRVQGGTPGAPAAPAAVSEPQSVETEVPADDSSESLPVESEPPIDPNAPLIARSQAPEKNTNLSAMRELANDSARSAISRSSRLQSRDAQLRAMSKFLVAAVVLICGLGVMISVPQMLIKVIGLSAGLFVAFCFVRDGVQILRDTRRRMVIEEHDPSEPAED